MPSVAMIVALRLAYQAVSLTDDAYRDALQGVYAQLLSACVTAYYDRGRADA